MSLQYPPVEVALGTMLLAASFIRAIIPDEKWFLKFQVQEEVLYGMISSPLPSLSFSWITNPCFLLHYFLVSLICRFFHLSYFLVLK